MRGSSASSIVVGSELSGWISAPNGSPRRFCSSGPSATECLTCPAARPHLVGGSCVCNSGYFRSADACVQINECEGGTHNCFDAAYCTDTAGSFSCACPPGYEGDGVNCTDIDECKSGMDNCAPDATCTNGEGTFSCTCNEGAYGDGVTCCADTDSDLVCDDKDNCLEALNTEQIDTDNHGIGDATD